ncbi:exonuclease 1 [Blastocystis sp. subtype 4]|uniref:exonuclease 1 n=1 Tax=Blastocystis sp. subtype 4 TaxID=944170 RepID=UPI000711C171|nr:exonuclease 1 [Blastocystis sp. subtype 4]KNB42296.1 exonuclease 1 [Blastocystis sp. subtype 4]|eukprot:XP_014525739.1 exonuclease 1 [Blastocystis sp. subtype 4]
MSIQRTKSLADYRGKRVAVDIMCWLHRGSISCAREIFLYNDSTKLTDYCISRLEELINNGITPYVVFDGANLPNKQITDDSRRLRREESLSRAKELEKIGSIAEARNEYYRALEITPELYVPLIRRLQALGIEYVVAPYEADAELGFLSRNNYVDFVITEDGDSLVYGCRCVLFKLDNGIGQEIDTSRLNECTEMNFCGWTHDMFTYMCVLSGCDYLPSLHGVGIRTAYSIVSKGKRPDHIFEMLRRKTEVPDLYVSGFMKAVFTFRHQTVFDPYTQSTIPLMPYSSALDGMNKDFLGPLLPQDIAIQVASGQIHPSTHQIMLTPTAEVMEEESPVLASPIHFSSPFISVSFRALIEKPSERGLVEETDLSHLDSRIKSVRKRPANPGVVAESPPRKRPLNRVEESPVINRSSFLDRFRSNFTSCNVC